MIIALSAILFLLLAIIGRKRGVKAFFTLYINLIFFIIAVVLICWGVSPILIAFLFSLGVSAFLLFFLNGINVKTITAYLSVLMVLIISAALVLFIGNKGKLSGFDLVQVEIVYLFDINIKVNYIYVAVAVILISLTGAVTDTALDIATSLNEVHNNNKQLSFVQLLKSGRAIGGDVLGTMINTIFFVFIGEFAGFFIYYSNYSLSFIINHKLLIQSASKFLIGGIGCILIIPVTILVQSYVYTGNSYFAQFINNRLPQSRERVTAKSGATDMDEFDD